ncbi:transcription factor bHLH148-like [Nymphaea colorata]|nr:transcription factor bHLH148-like [Nymphaea colorata]
MTPENVSDEPTPPKPAEEEPNVAGDGEGVGSSGGSRWRTSPEQRSYTQRLLKALRSAGGDATPADGVSRSFAVKEAADSALAMSAKGRSRWSRAILARWRRRRERFMSRKIRRVSLRRRTAMMEPSPSVPAAENALRTPAKRKRGGKEESVVDDRLRTLGRLIPGGQKLGAPALLEEAGDYIAALEMQVKAMGVLENLLSAAAPARP